MKKLLVAALALAVSLSACKSDDDEVTLRDITVEFASAQVGFDSDDSSESIVVNLTRGPETALTATIDLEAEGVEYGTHFTTSPAASNGVISLTLPAGQTTASITVSKVAGIFLEGTETVTFTLKELSETEAVKIGDKKASVLSFGSIVSEGSEMTLEGNTADENYLNSVFVDLSANKQTTANRKSWNLGFYCDDDFRVILNGTYATVAAPSTKTDINEVTLADAEALEIDLNTAAGMSMESVTPSVAFDSPDGNLTQTVFAEVSANAADNKVYFVASATQKTGDRGDWFKVKVTRSGNGYTVQYGKVSGGAVKTIEIEKNSDYNFIFLSLETEKIVDVEPLASKWDIKWSYDYGAAKTGSQTLYIFTQDFVAINYLAGVKVATVLVEDITYEDFKKSDIAGLTFESTRDAIGTDWRITAMPGTTNAGVNTTCFYVIQDPAGFYYKLRFERVGINDAGTRGRPEIKYALVE